MIMETAVNINQIVKEIEDLDYAGKLNILSYVVGMLKKSDVKVSYNIADLKGLGKDLWLKHDVEAYISKERESWD
jgi:hypothetical protein